MSFISWLRNLKARLSDQWREKQTRRPAGKKQGHRLYLEFLESRETPAAQPFSYLAPGLTQELVATLPGFGGGSGYAFDTQGNPYTIDVSGSHHLYKVDMSTTNLVDGSQIHPLIDLGLIHFPNGTDVYGGNFTSYPDGSVYLNAYGYGPLRVDLSTATVTSNPIPNAPSGFWGIGVDPQLNAAGDHNIIYSAGQVQEVDPVAGTYVGPLPNAFADGLAVDPSGNYVFTANGGLQVTTRTGTVIGNYGYSPDGIAFANTGTKQFVATADAYNATVSEWDFPQNNFALAPTRTTIASGAPSGTYLDQANVSPDGYLYLTYWDHTVFADGTVTNNGSIVRIGPAGTFIPPTHSDSISLSPASDSPNSGSELLTATVAESTNGGAPGPVSGKTVTFTVFGGPDAGETGTGVTDSNGEATFTLLNSGGTGTDDVHAQFVDVNGHTQTSNEAVITFTKVAPTLSVSDGGVYTGQPQQATGSALGADGKTAVSGQWTYTYYQGTDTTGTALSGAPTDVGTYTVVADFTSNDSHYTNGSTQQTFNITQATPTVSVTDNGGVYSGNPYAATDATASGVGGTALAAFGDSSLSYTYDDATLNKDGTYTLGTSLGSNAPVNAGTYAVVAHYAGSNDYAAADSAAVGFSITPAAPTLAVTDNGGVYDATAFTASGSALGVDGQEVAGSLSYTYYAGTSATGTPLGGAPADAGTYTVVADFTSQDGNYSDGTAQHTFTIKPYAFAYQIGNDSQSYGSPADLAKDLPATISTGVNNEMLDISYGSTGDTATANAGRYDITGSLSDGTGKASNYDVTLNPGTLTVVPFALTYAIGNDSQVYGSPADLAKDLPITISTGVNNETLKITYSSTGDTATAHVGKYAITGTPSDGTGLASNYSVTLTPGTLTVNPYAFSYHIGSLAQTYGVPANLGFLPATVNTGVNGQTLHIAYASGGDNVLAPVGSYAITGTLGDGSGRLSDYSVTLLPGTLQVLPAGQPVVAAFVAPGPVAPQSVAVNLFFSDPNQPAQAHFALVFWGDRVEAVFLGVRQRGWMPVHHRYDKKHHRPQTVVVLVLDAEGRLITGLNGSAIKAVTLTVNPGHGGQL
jgi:hypothetical protein